MEKRIIDIPSLPSVPFAARDTLPESSGVYLVMEETTILYVGKSRNMRIRWATHHLIKTLRQHANACIAWALLETEAERDSFESSVARMFKPIYNKSLTYRPPTHKNLSVLLHVDIHVLIQQLADADGLLMAQEVRLLIMQALKARGMLPHDS